MPGRLNIQKSNLILKCLPVKQTLIENGIYYFQKIIRELYQREKEYKKTIFKAQNGQEDVNADIVYDSMYTTNSQSRGIVSRQKFRIYLSLQ